MAGFKECIRGALLAAALVASGVLAAEREASATPFSTTSIPVGQSDWSRDWRVAATGARVLVGSPDGERARLFEKSGVSYVLGSTFAPTVSSGTSRFGSDVALAGERAIVGASADTNAAGVTTGAAYTYQRVAGLWTLSAKLLPSPGSTNGGFGANVAVSGDRLVVGAPGEGHVYVYDLVGSAWQQTVRLTGSRGAIDGNRVIVAGSLGTQSAVRVFDCNSAGCTATGVLLAGSPDANIGGFGRSMAVSGTRIVVGAPDFAMSTIPHLGRVFVYELVSGNWLQVASLSEGQGLDPYVYGASVALSGERLVVGAPFDSDVFGLGSGRVYVYERPGTSFVLRDTLQVTDSGFCWDFGSSLALDGTRLVAGYYLHHDTETDPALGPIDTRGMGTVQAIELVAPAPTPAPASGVFGMFALAAALSLLGASVVRGRQQRSGENALS